MKQLRAAATFAVAVALFSCGCARSIDGPLPYADDDALELIPNYLGVRDDTFDRVSARAEACLGTDNHVSGVTGGKDGVTRVPGVLLPDDAEKLGYDGLDAYNGSTSKFFEVVREDLERSYADSGGPAVVAVADYGGVEVTVDLGACTSSALREGFGSVDEGAWHLMVLEYLYSSMDEAALAAQVEPLFEPWSDCIAKHDYDFETPRDAWLSGSRDPGPGFEVAVADAACREDVGLNEVIRLRALNDAASILVEDHAATNRIAEFIEGSRGDQES